MKVVCSKDTLLKGIGIVLGAVSQKSTLPLLSNLLFDAKGNNLTLAATDLEVAVKTIIPAQVLKEGGTTLPGKLVSDIVRKFDSSEIEVSSDEQEKILIKSGKTKFSLVGIPKTEFPVAINFEGGKSFTIETSVLKDMIIKTKFAISTDETRYVLNGIYFVIEKGRAIMVATDGKRLAFISNDDVVDKKLSFSLIIPSKAIEELLKIISNTVANEIEVGVFDNQVGFKVENTILRSRLIDGHFPNYDQVIPKEKKGSIKIKTKDLLDATERISLISSGRTSSIKYSIGKGKVMLYSMEQGRGEGNDEIEIEYKGENLDVAYNPNYIIDMLKVVDSKEVIFEFNTPVSPGVLKPDNDSNYVYIIMPMRLE
ncbi:MAG: DNA polymerase III subunit beta [Elusimicrobia bacterium RIFOXYD2_FULL_34_15]|nr:MAG: DNA polymerase III subunit beta [Elusimicrobia bacterium RIFOXYD2_FULL_34_15]